MDPILAVLFGKESLPAPEADLLKKILADNLVTIRAQEAMVAQYAAGSILRMNALEKEALKKRISPAPRPVGTASFSIVNGTFSGRSFVRASCEICKQETHFGTPEPWTETVEYQGRPIIKTHRVDRAAVASALQNLKWQHCGHTDRPNEYLIAEWEQILVRLIPEGAS